MDKFLVVHRKSEREMNVNINIGIILSWAFLDGCIVVDDVFGEEADNSPIAEIAPVSACCHQGLGSTTVFLEDGEVGWHVHLDITAAALVAPSDHSHDALVVATWVVVIGVHKVSSLRETASMALGDSGHCPSQS